MKHIIRLIICSLPAIFMLTVVLLLTKANSQAGNPGFVRDQTFRLGNVDIKRFYDKDANILCYVTDAVNPSISCTQLR